MSIAKNFMTTYPKVATHDGEDEPIQIWAKDSDAYGGVGTDKLGIWGSVVAVDFDACVADGACIEAWRSRFTNGWARLNTPPPTRRR